MLQAMIRKGIFKILLIVVPLMLLLHLSYHGIITPLIEKDGARGISNFRSFFPSWNKVCTKQVYVRPPPWSDSLPTIYVITATYTKFVQKADLTRLSHTLLHVPNLHWIVVEDSENKTALVRDLLKSTGLRYTHLNGYIPTPYKFRGTRPRNVALKWLRDTFSVNDNNAGVVYIADDDNTYSLELFEEMRYTKKVSVWPVSFVGSLRFESCKVNNLGKVYGWVAHFAPNRRFAIDMAGFAVNLQLILSKPNVYLRMRGLPEGHQETRFLEDLVTLSDLEPKAANCTKVLVWHTRTEKPRHFKFSSDPNIET